MGWCGPHGVFLVTAVAWGRTTSSCSTPAPTAAAATASSTRAIRFRTCTGPPRGSAAANARIPSRSTTRAAGIRLSTQPATTAAAARYVRNVPEVRAAAWPRSGFKVSVAAAGATAAEENP